MILRQTSRRSLITLIKRTAFGRYINYFSRRYFSFLFEGYSSDYTKSVNGTFQQKGVRVAVLGADTATGELLSFLLKQNPIVSQIYLYGDIVVEGIAEDLRHMDTRGEVAAFYGPNGVNKAIRCADIVLLIGKDKTPLNATAEDRLRNEMDNLVMYTKACTKYAPRSLIGVCVRPISCSLPIVSDIFRGTHWYHPGRIIGCATLMQVRINAYVGHYYGLDPVSVHVPFIGGPDTDNVVPLFSRAKPLSVLTGDISPLNNFLKNWKNSASEKCNTPIMMVSAVSEAYAINQFVTTMALGLCGDDYAICTAFVRQNIIKHCRYLVTTVQFGPEGVVHNYGVPCLTKGELVEFERSIYQLKEREKMGLKVLTLTDKPPEPKIAKRMIAYKCAG
ncbi:hypothetical protein RI129_010333 [Pyrocoelia pectoralis]|uniref:Malate dehydrogenase, mitochondrial n=1 Tax=Pyrocoelia pectoralis TaxID=417401 RepID=A0AAN7VAA7_9COLE